MGHWLDLRLDQPGANRDAIGAWIEVQAGDRRHASRGDGRRRPRRAASSAGSTSGSVRPTGRRSASSGPTARWARGCPSTADGFDVVERGATAAQALDAVARRGDTVTAPTRRAAPRRRSTCPTSACPASARRSRRRCTRRASTRSASAPTRARLRSPRRLRRPRAQRQPVVPDRLRPALRGGAPGRRAGRRPGDPRRQRVLRHGRCRAAADAAASVPGPEPAEPAPRPLRAPRRDPRRGGDRRRAAGSVSSAGRPYADRASIDAPAFLVDELRR